MPDPTLELVGARAAALKRRSFAELSALESYQDEEVVCGSGPVTVAVWKDAVGGHELRIVVQAYRRVLLASIFSQAEGFRIDDTGRFSDLTEGDLEEFA